MNKELENYIINNHANNPLWFEEEIKKTINKTRISKVFDLKEYLN